MGLHFRKLTCQQWRGRIGSDNLHPEKYWRLLLQLASVPASLPSQQVSLKSRMLFYLQVFLHSVQLLPLALGNGPHQSHSWLLQKLSSPCLIWPLMRQHNWHLPSARKSIFFAALFIQNIFEHWLCWEDSSKKTYNLHCICGSVREGSTGAVAVAEDFI